MDYLQLLNAAASLFPAASSLLTIIEGARASGTVEALAIASNLVPIATQFFSTLDAIRAQTETKNPAVWAGIRDDWKDTYARAKALGLA